MGSNRKIVQMTVVPEQIRDGVALIPTYLLLLDDEGNVWLTALDEDHLEIPDDKVVPFVDGRDLVR